MATDLFSQRRRYGSSRSGSFEQLKVTPTEQTNGVAGEASASIASRSIPRSQPVLPNGNVADQTVPFAERTTNNGRVTGLGGRALPGGGVESNEQAQSRILGTREPGQSASQKAGQAAFDEKMGFTTSPTGSKGSNDANEILSNRSKRLEKDPYDLDYAENTTGTFGSSNAQLNASRQNLPTPAVSSPVAATAPAPAAQVAAPSASGSAGLTTPTNPIAQLRYPASGPETPTLPTPGTSYASTTDAQPSALPSPTAVAAGGSPLSANPPVSPNPTPVEGGGGNAIASGVSNSQAAGFTTPTKANPIPQTPTSPAMDVEDYDQKKQFSGFK